MKIYNKTWPVAEDGTIGRPSYLIDGPNNAGWDMNHRGTARVIFFDTRFSRDGKDYWRWVAAKFKDRRGWWLCSEWHVSDNFAPIPGIGPFNSRMEAYGASKLLNQ